MLIGVQALLEQVIPGEDHDDGQVLVDKRQHTVLQLTAHDGLAVQVADLLDLERTFQGSGELGSTAEKQEALLVLELLRAELLDLVVLVEHGPDLLRDLAKTLHDLLSPPLLAGPVFTEGQRKHDHGDELGGVGLGGGNTDLGTRVDVDTAVCEQRDGGSDHVDNPDGQGSPFQAVLERQEGIGRLTGLGHEHARVVTEDGCLSVEEIRSQLNGDGDLGELLKHTTNSHTRVI